MPSKALEQLNILLTLGCGKNRTAIGHNVFISVFICLCMMSCGSIATKIAVPKNVTEHTIQTNSFQIYSLQKLTALGNDVVFYIEGDGKAWITPTQLSTNPTPVSTLVREWAFKDKRPNVVYLARPCQYTNDPACQTTDFGTYWSEKRFAPEIITAMSEAIDQIKIQSHATNIILIGYSGGGAVAALLAARRNDVSELISVAGNLDTEMHSMIHHVSPLAGSLNPRDFASQIHVKQIHYSGENDENVPAAVAKSFVAALPVNVSANIVVIPGATHHAGWENIPALLTQ